MVPPQEIEHEKEHDALVAEYIRRRHEIFHGVQSCRKGNQTKAEELQTLFNEFKEADKQLKRKQSTTTMQTMHGAVSTDND